MLKKRKRVLLVAILIGISMLMPYAKVNSACEKKEGVDDHVLLFCSDIHEKTESNLKTLMKRFKETGIRADYICFGGDYAQTFKKEALADTRKITKKYFPKTSILMTTGNHDQMEYQSKAFQEVTKQKSPRLAAQEKGYCIYMLGASGKEQEFTKTDLKDLKVFLDEWEHLVPKIPVFIVSHFPIHYYKGEVGERTTKHAKEMVELLNQYSNVIFLYGHNHTLKDENYTMVHMPGDELEIEKDSYMGIHFPYSSMGAVKDGASMDVYGLKITIEHTVCCNKVIFEHVNLYAEPKDKMMICFPITE